ncbi:MAG: hypothetical protein MUF31_05625 [Akkermansiaceae bacterium]|jgi:endonuclease YncB( thermonuclease family)|nr:hypothetical protein [Akkermansiaceae bacterium]
MAIRAKTQSWQVIVLIAAALALMAVERWKPGLLRSWRDQPATSERTPGSESRDTTGKPSSSDKPAVVGGYERLEGCEWIAHRQNDGDSFRLKLPDGRVEQFRLYFVDCPESAFKEYGRGENNHDRIRQQARDMGVTDDEVVALGKRAKQEVERLLAGKSITLYTEWDDPFGDRRYHAFVELPGGGWLHEWLVSEGLARVHTKGAMLPDGTAEAAHERALEQREREARAER